MNSRKKNNKRTRIEMINNQGRLNSTFSHWKGNSWHNIQWEFIKRGPNPKTNRAIVIIAHTMSNSLFKHIPYKCHIIASLIRSTYSNKKREQTRQLVKLDGGKVNKLISSFVWINEMNEIVGIYHRIAIRTHHDALAFIVHFGMSFSKWV